MASSGTDHVDGNGSIPNGIPFRVSNYKLELQHFPYAVSRGPKSR